MTKKYTQKIARLEATVRRLRKNIRQIYRNNEPLDGPAAEDGGTGEFAAEHAAEMRRMLK